MKISRKYNIILALVIVILFITIAYATLSTNLMINGSSKINNSTWNVYWDNLHVSDGSISLDSNDNTLYPAIINTSDNTRVEYSIELGEPGTFYEFTIDAKNDGSIDAMIDTISSTIKIDNGEVQNINSDTLPSWLKYSVTYSDGIDIERKHALLSKTSEKYKVRIEFKKEISNSQFNNATGTLLTFSFSVKYAQKDNTAILLNNPASFASDDWATIIRTVKSGNTSIYNVGDTKEIDLGSLGTHRLRIVNNTTPDECLNENFSQTACGFVLDFSDVIFMKKMNLSSSNTGSWRDSYLREFLNNEIEEDGYLYNSLPNLLKKSIVPTRVVSGFGCNYGWDSTNSICNYPDNNGSNYMTIDKFYIPSTVELYGEPYLDTVDTSYTRQFDLYHNLGASIAQFGYVSKRHNGSGVELWVRSPNSSNSYYFILINTAGNVGVGRTPNTGLGISPAFRLG